jgi:hypothetical protein
MRPEFDEIARKSMYIKYTDSGNGTAHTRIFLLYFQSTHSSFVLVVRFFGWTTRFQGGGFSDSEWVIHGVQCGYGNEMD